jgi:hypothetical protein
MNMGVQMSLNYTDPILFEYIPSRKVAELCGAIFNFFAGVIVQWWNPCLSCVRPWA